MKKCTLLISLLVFMFQFLVAQSADYKIVFDLTSKDTIDHQAVIRQMSMISQGNPEAKLEVVLYGQSLDMILKDKSVVAEGIRSLTTNKNLSFKVCAATMKRHNVDKSQLLPGIEVVPDGIYEIYTKQKEGWGYIKAGH